MKRENLQRNDAIFRLRQEGHSYREIGERFGISATQTRVVFKREERYRGYAARLGLETVEEYLDHIEAEQRRKEKEEAEKRERETSLARRQTAKLDPATAKRLWMLTEGTPPTKEYIAQYPENRIKGWFSHPQIEEVCAWLAEDGLCFAYDPTPRLVEITADDVNNPIIRDGMQRFGITFKIMSNVAITDEILTKALVDAYRANQKLAREHAEIAGKYNVVLSELGVGVDA